MPLMRFLALLLAFLPLGAPAQHGHGGSAALPEEWPVAMWFEEGPFRKPYKMDVGLPFPVTTLHVDAQGWFDQGAALLAAGWLPEARRSFRQVLYLDPGCAMALWGLAMTFRDQLEVFESMQEAIAGTLASPVLTEWEKRYLKAMAEDGADATALAKAYQSIAEAFPFDQEAETWAALVAPDKLKKSLLEKVLKRDANHPIGALALTYPELGELVALPDDQSPLVPLWIAHADFSAAKGADENAVASYGQALTKMRRHMDILSIAPSEEPLYCSTLEACAHALVRLGDQESANRLQAHWEALPKQPGMSSWKKPLEKAGAYSLSNPLELSWIAHLVQWSGPPATSWRLPDADGKARSLHYKEGRHVLMICFLGRGCVHCMEQLDALAPLAEAYEKAGIDLIAVSLDTVEGLGETFKKAATKEPFQFPLVSDEKLTVFKMYDAFDAFDAAPLHGLYLINDAGVIEWSQVGHEPFMQTKWLLEECQRLMRQRPRVKVAKADLP